MILVWSTRLSPAATAKWRVCWRTLTTSSDDRMARRSVFVVVTINSLRVGATLNQRHAAVDIQRCSDAGQGQAKLDQGDCDCGAHADDDRFGVEDAGHSGDIVQHAADETVDDFQRRNVDEHALGPE